jgi:AraC-like DNA-binding protein
MESDKSNVIQVWRLEQFPQLELRQGFAVARPVPRHWHDEYQICLVQSGSGELKYRGASFVTPPAALFIVHPGEVHSNFAHGGQGCSYRDLFIGPEMIRRAAAQLQRKDKSLPFFKTVVVSDPLIVRRYLRMHYAFERPASNLERESLLLGLLANLLERFTEDRAGERASGTEPRRLRRACDYLVEHHADNISLENLARIAALSPFHFNRLFSAQFGMPPHQFQTLVRVSRARALLREGWSIPQTASQVGFFDQSHFNRHFKRIIGVTPGQYRVSSKNVQDALRPAPLDSVL